jgi:hypothetical protein
MRKEPLSIQAVTNKPAPAPSVERERVRSAMRTPAPNQIRRRRPGLPNSAKQKRKKRTAIPVRLGSTTDPVKRGMIPPYVLGSSESVAGPIRRRKVSENRSATIPNTAKTSMRASPSSAPRASTRPALSSETRTRATTEAPPETARKWTTRRSDRAGSNASREETRRTDTSAKRDTANGRALAGNSKSSLRASILKPRSRRTRGVRAR